MFQRNSSHQKEFSIRSPASLRAIFCKVFLWFLISLLLIVACGILWGRTERESLIRVNTGIIDEVKTGFLSL